MRYRRGSLVVVVSACLSLFPSCTSQRDQAPALQHVSLENTSNSMPTSHLENSSASGEAPLEPGPIVQLTSQEIFEKLRAAVTSQDSVAIEQFFGPPFEHVTVGAPTVVTDFEESEVGSCGAEYYGTPSYHATPKRAEQFFATIAGYLDWSAAKVVRPAWDQGEQEQWLGIIFLNPSLDLWLRREYPGEWKVYAIESERPEFVDSAFLCANEEYFEGKVPTTSREASILLEMIERAFSEQKYTEVERLLQQLVPKHASDRFGSRGERTYGDRAEEIQRLLPCLKSRAMGNAPPNYQELLGVLEGIDQGREVADQFWKFGCDVVVKIPGEADRIVDRHNLPSLFESRQRHFRWDAVETRTQDYAFRWLAPPWNWVSIVVPVVDGDKNFELRFVPLLERWHLVEIVTRDPEMRVALGGRPALTMSDKALALAASRVRAECREWERYGIESPNYASSIEELASSIQRDSHNIDSGQESALSSYRDCGFFFADLSGSNQHLAQQDEFAKHFPGGHSGECCCCERVPSRFYTRYDWSNATLHHPDYPGSLYLPPRNPKANGPAVLIFEQIDGKWRWTGMLTDD